MCLPRSLNTPCTHLEVKEEGRRTTSTLARAAADVQHFELVSRGRYLVNDDKATYLTPTMSTIKCAKRC